MSFQIAYFTFTSEVLIAFPPIYLFLENLITYSVKDNIAVVKLNDPNSKVRSEFFFFFFSVENSLLKRRIRIKVFN